MQPFTDIDMALAHAQQVANQYRGSNRRSVYLVQHGNMVNVQTNKPLSNRVMLKIKPMPYPRSKSTALKEVKFQTYGNYRAYLYRNGGYFHLGLYRDFFEACCAKFSAENEISKINVG